MVVVTRLIPATLIRPSNGRSRRNSSGCTGGVGDGGGLLLRLYGLRRWRLLLGRLRVLRWLSRSLLQRQRGRVGARRRLLLRLLWLSGLRRRRQRVPGRGWLTGLGRWLIRRVNSIVVLTLLGRLRWGDQRGVISLGSLDGSGKALDDRRENLASLCYALAAQIEGPTLFTKDHPCGRSGARRQKNGRARTVSHSTTELAREPKHRRGMDAG